MHWRIPTATLGRTLLPLPSNRYFVWAFLLIERTNLSNLRPKFSNIHNRMNSGPLDPTDSLEPDKAVSSQGISSALLTGLESEISQLYEAGGAANYGLLLADFRRIVSEIVNKYATANSEQEEVRELLKSLRADELCLARGCAAGNETAWEVLLTRFREPLYEMATAIARDEERGRELADSLYGDLYGLTQKGEQRSSKLNSYMGIGSLMGWLRTVLSQGFIDRYRREQKLVNLDEEEESEGHALPQAVTMPAVDEKLDPRLEKATETALSALSAEERFILKSYYLDDQTLAEIARTLGVHESTISRKVEKIAGALQKKIRVTLLKMGLSKAEIEDAFSADVRDMEVNVRARLQESSQESGTGSFYQQRTSKPKSGRER